MIGVIILAILVVMLISFIVWLRRKNNKLATKTVGTVTPTTGSKNKTWKKKSPYIWFFILQFIVLNFIYPGGWFEVKTLFWFFATRNSDKYVAIKKISDILEKEEKKKISDIRAEIEKIEGKTEITDRDKMKLGELANEAVNVGKPTPPPQKVPAKLEEEVWDWTFEWEATAEQLASGRQETVGLINDAQIISCDDNVLKFRYKRPSGKIVNLTLGRDNPETEFYFGRVAQSDLYLRVWLLPDEKGNFKGQFDNGPGKTSMEVFLKKRS